MTKAKGPEENNRMSNMILKICIQLNKSTKTLKDFITLNKICIQLNKFTKTLKDFITLKKIGIQLNKSIKTLKDFTTLNKIGIQLDKSKDIERFHHSEQDRHST